MAKEKKEKKKETSAVKYNTSGHYCGRRYNQLTVRNLFITTAVLLVSLKNEYTMNQLKRIHTGTATSLDPM